jgi:hypothetical protein
LSMDDFAVDSEYHYLLDDPDFRRFIQNVRRRSETSASELLRRFGMIHKRFQKLPKDFAKMDTKQAKHFLLDMKSNFSLFFSSRSMVSNNFLSWIDLLDVPFCVDTQQDQVLVEDLRVNTFRTVSMSPYLRRGC